ncbi:neural/ectodermal development factor IMP-L2 isoform X1 [Phlebotomus papatasi]|uniref:neural/ectodermal development factor IMP-L2 isoform X1 n=2 Tax=Phlebotomus papatasi TaxID=29031 RepID=UPI002484135D|nr:neural/ectodermal development factor IMP-L2 isoform X1 [Phlebotomus papatasi]
MREMEMGSSLLFAIGIFLVCGLTSARSISEPNNSLQSNGDSGKFIEAQDWVKVTAAPPVRITHEVGATVELECEVAGSPPPTIHWVRGNTPLNLLNEIEANVVSEASPNALARVRSRLILEHAAPTERTYTCVGRSGSQTAFASTTVIASPHHGRPKHNLTSDIINTLLSPGGGAQKPRIVLYYTVVLELLGSDIVLPCNTIGRPRPDIYWLDGNDNLISGQEPRYRVLPTGELIITNLKWSDMGGFTCVARNALAKDTITTFVYPVLNEE